MMPKRGAFTLIEVMVSVMIISVVIAALLQMRGNTSNKLIQLNKMNLSNQYTSFLISVDDKYTKEDSHMDMKRLVEEFDLDTDLRKKLSSIPLELSYKKIKTIDMSKSDNEGNSEQSQIVFEIGQTTMHTKSFTNNLIRVQLQ